MLPSEGDEEKADWSKIETAKTVAKSFLKSIVPRSSCIYAIWDSRAYSSKL